MKNLKIFWTNFLIVCDKSIHKFVSLIVSAYRTIGTTYMGGSCRFQPSCSEYAVECLHNHNGFYSFYLISKRLLKCRPGGPFGYDPVPIKIKKDNGDKDVCRK